MGLFSDNESHVGVDIGTSGIKIVELQKKGNKNFLLTYGFAELSGFKDLDWQKDIKYTAKIIDKTIKKAGVSSKSAIAALPVFKVFSSVLNLSKVPKKEVEEAISREAGEIMPMPIEDMVLDWKKMSANNSEDKKYFKVFVTGAPKELVQSYVELFKEANINLSSLETESFSLIRSLLGNDKSSSLIVEIGAGTTDIFVAQKGIPVLSRSIDLGGRVITEMISKQIGGSPEEAEQFKRDLGNSGQDDLPENIKKAIEPIVNEIKYVLNLFSKKRNENVEKIVLSGGSSMLPGLTNYFAQTFDLNTVVGDPWSRVDCSPEITPVLKSFGPRLAVAIGLAMRGKE